MIEPPASDPIERLDTVLVHHIVNTLGWPDLRPLQRASIDPLLRGDDAILLAPTAGGKTESACFPLLTAMAADNWPGVSVLYLCPLKALLNNLVTRIDTYAQWIGRSAALWHGDTRESARNRIRREPPDILLTTPESLEAMLIGIKTDHQALLGSVRAVVVDEVHAFAGDDRGWHLLAVLERLQRVTGQPIQRIGLSATVGNPHRLLTWLQGSGSDKRRGTVVAPDLPELATEDTSAGSRFPTDSPPLPRPAGEVELDYVGSLDNAAKVIAALHRGEKRLVFCDSRRQVEQLGAALREREVTVFLSHASLSASERARSEQAFAEARDCVIVSTSTLELGIDVGDLDRVIQIDSPATVASFLQRTGRTGRRAGTTRNCLFLTTTADALLQAAGLLLLWSRGWVEPVTAPPQPRHLVAQQLLAVTLQHGTIGKRLWSQEWNGLAPFDRSAEPIFTYLLEAGYLDSDQELAFIGPQADRRFGMRNFLELTASFTAPPQFTILAGRQEIGMTDVSVLTDDRPGPRLLLLAGSSWRVTYIDWKRRRAFVEPAEGRGIAKWSSLGIRGLSAELCRAMRAVLLGSDPDVSLTRRAQATLTDHRQEAAGTVAADATLITREKSGTRWWTWAGYRANATLAAALAPVADPAQRPDDFAIRLDSGLTPVVWNDVRKTAEVDRLPLPGVDSRAVAGLKFSALLPDQLASATIGSRLADPQTAQLILRDPVRWAAR